MTRALKFSLIAIVALLAATSARARHSFAMSCCWSQPGKRYYCADDCFTLWT